MREILFKAKRIDNSEWVQGNLFIEENRAEITRGICNGIGIEGIAVDKDTICQYTGLTDKNGNRIWENDILLSEPPLIPTPQFVVKYNQCTASFSGIYLDYEKAFAINDEMTKYCKVVGNLFDNDVVAK